MSSNRGADSTAQSSRERASGGARIQPSDLADETARSSTATIGAMRWSSACLAALLIAAGCTSGPSGNAESAPSVATGESAVELLPAIEIDTRPGPFQLTIDAAPAEAGPGTTIEAADGSGRPLTVATVAHNNTALLRDLPPGPVTLFVVDDDGTRVAQSPPVVVPGDQPPDSTADAVPSLANGLNYIPTRDGTTLSTFVTLPGPADAGPYPTLVEYSGYTPSRPGGDDPGRLLVPALGYALVQVNLRGTGCSGGSFDAFEQIQALDGYDVIEAVAAQDWSAKVGMYGISFAGITQLHVAATRPPSLAAIAPLSILDRVESVLYPGGIYNNGFGENWTRRVGDQAQAFGQGWEQARVDAGDEVCEANQRLRIHNPDLVETIRSSPFTDDFIRSRSPDTTAEAINIPVFLAGAWQDEQTGGRWPAIIDDLSGASPLRAYLYNGLHADPISPEILGPLTEFYDIYLEDPDPGAGTLLSLALATGLASVYGEALPVDFNRFDPADLEGIRSDYESADPIRVLFEMGADRPNLPVPGFTASFDSWPPPLAEATSFFLADTDGSSADTSGTAGGFALDVDEPDATDTRTLRTDPAEGDRTIGGTADRIWSNDPGWDWPRADAANVVVATSEALSEDLVVVGPAGLDVWVSADADDADLEVTVSEIAPDGSETYVQNGWLRLSRRALDAESTELRPVISGLETDVVPLEPDGEPVLARIEILPFAHVFRQGSQIRATVDTPGASRPQWRFGVGSEPVTVTIHSGPDHLSRLVLPVLPGASAPTPRPACGSLRGQPCR